MNSDVRILFLIPGEEEGNSMIFSKNEVKQLQENNFNVRTFFLKERRSLKGLLKEAKKFKKTINEFNPIFVHCHFGTITGFFCFLFSSVPYVITFHGSDLNFAKDRSFFSNLLAIFLSHISSIKAKKIICVSNKLKSKLLFFCRKKTHVIPATVDTNQFIVFEKKIAREKLNLQLDKYYVLFNASNPIIKRLDLATETEQYLKKNFSNKIEFIYLNGNFEHSLLPILMNAVDLLLLCSDTEGSPVIIKEAMACNLPIVANDVGDVKEITEGVYPNSILPDREINTIANEIIKIIKLNTRSNGREVLFSKKLTMNDNLQKLISVYDELTK